MIYETIAKDKLLLSFRRREEGGGEGGRGGDGEGHRALTVLGEIRTWQKTEAKYSKVCQTLNKAPNKNQKEIQKNILTSHKREKAPYLVGRKQCI